LAAKRIAWGKFLNAGQTCVAPDYVLVPRENQDQLIERLKYHLHAFYGPDIKASPDYSRIINQRHFDRIKQMIVADKVAFGGEEDHQTHFFHPTILKDVNCSDKVMEDEIFGPLLPLVPYDSLEEALGVIFSYPKPLAFYLFSEDKKKQDEILQRVPFGGGCVNDTLIHLANPHLPFGGVGSSGMGSYHGKKSFETFTHFKSVYDQSSKVDIPLRYPPYKGKLNLLKYLIR
jgi:aldehyde dehydrogenase (NAD+)